MLVCGVLIALSSSTATSQDVRARLTRTIQNDGRPAGPLEQRDGRSPSNKDAAELEVGRPIEFTYPRGEVAIRGVVVRSADVVDYPYPARYFVMLNGKQVANGWSLSMSLPLRVNADKVEPVPPSKSLFTGLTLTEMRAIVKGLK